MEEALVAALLADAGVAALVATRITWSLRATGAALPAIVLHKISAPRDYTFAGRVGLVGHLVQVDSWASSALAAVKLARAAQAVMDTLTAAPFQGAFIENERSDSFAGDGPQGSAPTNLFRTSLDVRVWHAS